MFGITSTPALGLRLFSSALGWSAQQVNGATRQSCPVLTRKQQQQPTIGSRKEPVCLWTTHHHNISCFSGDWSRNCHTAAVCVTPWLWIAASSALHICQHSITFSSLSLFKSSAPSERNAVSVKVVVPVKSDALKQQVRLQMSFFLSPRAGCMVLVCFLAFYCPFCHFVEEYIQLVEVQLSDFQASGITLHCIIK